MLRADRVFSLLLLAAAAPAVAQQPIAMGQLTEGELSAAADRKDEDGKSYDTWSFTARAGATYMITLRSEDFDSYLQAGLADDEDCASCQTNDDADGSDSRVVVEAETGGARLIRVTTFEAGESGRYTLAVEEVEALPPPGAEPSPASRGGGVLRPGVVATGVLQEGDRRGPFNPRVQNSLYDVWTYRGSAGETLTLTLSSAAFDAFLRVYRWDGSRWRSAGGNDDERGGTTNSKVVLTIPADGEYQVHAAAFYEPASGAYTLTASSSPGAGPVAAAPATTDELPILAPGGSKDGALADGDPVGSDFTFYDAYRYFASAGETAIFELASEDFDTMLRIGVRENGVWREVARDNDGGRFLQSELTITFPERAEYELRVGTITAGARGAYSLFALTDIHADVEARMPPGTLTVGHTSRGTLEASDERDEGGALLDVWTLPGSEGNQLTIDLRSDQFDPLLRIFAERPDGTLQLLGESEDDGMDGDSRLTVTLPANGRYRIHVTSSFVPSRGRYRLLARF
jgi:hypothetical protein